MLASLAFTIFVGFMTAIDDDFAVLLFLPFLGFVFGLLNVFYGAFLADKKRRKKQCPKAHVASMMPVQQGLPAELPAARSAPIESFPKRVATAEMVQPPSVTENTTRLLDEDSDPRRG